MSKRVCITPPREYSGGQHRPIDIDRKALHNKDFRKILQTSPFAMQVVVMSLRPEQEIGLETHPSTDQFLKIVKGSGVATVDSSSYDLKAGSALLVVAGTRHNVINTGNEDLKLYTIYAPPEHE